MIDALQKLFRILAVLLVVGGVAGWLVTGAHRGWTKNRVEKRTIDEVTGIEGITYEDRFVPGVDFLAGTIVGAGVLAGISLLFRKRDKNMNRIAPATVVAGALALSAFAEPQTFDFKDPKGVNNAIFKTDAVLESINGAASGISGTVTFDSANPGATKGKIVVAANSLTVPNKMMNEHLFGPMWLDVKTHPEITFDVKELKNVKTSGDNTTADAAGTFTMHGVSKELTVPVKLTYLPGKLGQRVPNMKGDLLVIRTNFELKRTDFKINPGSGNDKVSDEINLSLSIAGASPK